MKFIKPSEIADPDLAARAAKLQAYRFKQTKDATNLPVWYDGVSDILQSRQAFHVEPSGRVRFVLPDGDKFTMGELAEQFGKGLDVVVVCIREGKNLQPHARVVHCGKKNHKGKPANKLATAMLILNFMDYLEDPLIIRGPALFCHESQIILH